ncbi:hypothetical protein GQ54DRAFT_247879, partial [Martensiomyces pterosporus]
PICRVCRGEATESEPLFHPCKCSGSIKYVHQDCLEEWLAHSNKKYCELCGHEYAFSPLYDPSMPESIPKSIIVRQMLANVVSIILTFARAIAVVAMWLFVLPYIVYWLTRFYFWSGQSFVPSGADAVPGGGVEQNANATLSSRFVGYSSWYDWYISAQNSNSTIAPITSHTGVLEGATNTALILYSVTRITLGIGARLLNKSLGIRISEKRLNAIVESVVEALAKCLEGSIVTVIAILVFLALFILRDWIMVNMPMPEDFVEEINEQIEHAQQAQEEAAAVPRGNAAQNPRDADNRLRVMAQPIAAEDPQHRPLFELPEFDLPVLNDLPPGERPIRQQQQPHRHQRAWADSKRYGADADNSDRSEDGEGCTAEEERGAGAQNVEASREAVPGSSSNAGDSDQPETDNEQDAAGQSHTDASAEDESSMEVDSVDHYDSKGKRAETATDPECEDSDSEAQSTTSRPQLTEADDAWSFVFGESSKSAGELSGSASKDTANASHHDSAEPLPPTFTTEHARGIFAPVSPQRPSDDEGGSENDQSGEDRANVDLDAQLRRQMALIRELQRERNMDGLQLDELLRPNPNPNPNPGFGRNQPQQADPHGAFRQEQLGGQAQAPVAAAAAAAEAGPALDGNPEVIGEDMDDNFGDFEGADGLLDAIGFRGPLINAIQYFILVLSMVSLVLACSAWIPFICGRAAISAHPIRLLLYPVHACIVAIDTAADFLIVTLFPLAWAPIRPLLVSTANSIGPIVVQLVSLIAPGVKETLSAADGSLWDKLTSPRVQLLVLEKLRQSWVIGLLFPWIQSKAPEHGGEGPTRTASGDSGIVDIVRSAASAVSVSAATQIAATSSTGSGLFGMLRNAAMAAAAAGAGSLLDPSSIPPWERELWQRFIRWGIPIDAIAARLQQAATGATLHDRLLTISIGHMLGILAAWLITRYMPRSLRQTAVYSASKMFLQMIKIASFVMIELLAFPTMCGLCLGVSLIPLQKNASLDSRAEFLAEHTRVALFIHWFIGMVFMYHFANFVSYCREVMRPGLLWFIRDPNDPQFRPMREILERDMLPQLYKIGTSALMYCGIIAACFGVTSYAVASSAPGAFPMQWDSNTHITEYPADLHLVHFLLPIAIAWGRPQEMLRSLTDRWWAVAARISRLSDFIVGQRDIVEEGRWVVRSVPWMPVALPTLWMPVDVVRQVFAAFDAENPDEARTGPIAGALPTHEYRARLQMAIDRALAAQHPGVAFVLDGQNVRVPALDTVPVVPGRKMVVPVDDFGRPLEDQFDYEVADNPELRNAEDNQGRDIPAAAPEDGERDLRYKPEHYSVVYTPPRLRLHVAVFLVLGWAAIALTFAAILVLSLAIGRMIYRRLWDLPTHDVYSFVLGLLALIAIGVVVHRTATQVARLVDEDGDRAERVREVKKQVKQAFMAAWKLTVTAAVFYGIVPAVYGLVVEIYGVVVIRNYLETAGVRDVFARTLRQAMVGNWLFSVMNLRVAMSILTYFPDLRWSRELDRLFTGPPRTWHVWRGVYVFALPVVVVSVFCAAMPFGLTALVMWRHGTLSSASLSQVVALEDVVLLAWSSKVLMLAAAVVGSAWQAAVVYKRWSRHVRDRVYLVGQQLHNL